jgi:hypothetical protein
MLKLSPHFSLEEMTVSETAVRHGIINKPSGEALGNLRALCVHLLEKVRDLTDSPIIVTSGYRSVLLNSLIGGAPNSQHIAGEAADIRCKDLDQQELFDLIRNSDLPFDQIIDEFGSWVHISYTADRTNRRDVLRARRVNGATRYTRLKKTR